MWDFYLFFFPDQHIYTQLQEKSTVIRHYLFNMSGSKIKAKIKYIKLKSK